MSSESTCLQRSPYGIISYKLVGNKIKWIERNGQKFDIVRGNKYKVHYDNPQRAKHKNAVGVYVGSGNCEHEIMAILECCGKQFQADSLALMPWDGEITREHLKLISTKGKYHLMRDGRCACKCDSTPIAESRLLCDEDFLVKPENSRCKMCGYALKREVSS